MLRVPILTGRRWLYLMDWQSRHTGDPSYRQFAVDNSSEQEVRAAVEYFLAHPDEYGHRGCCGHEE